MHNLPTPYNPQACNPEDYLSISMARRNILATSLLTDNESMVTRRNNSIPGDRTASLPSMTMARRNMLATSSLTDNESMLTRQNNSVSGDRTSHDRNELRMSMVTRRNNSIPGTMNYQDLDRRNNSIPGTTYQLQDPRKYKEYENSYRAPAASWHQQKQELTPSKQDSSIPKKKLPTSYAPNDYNLPGMSMACLNDVQVQLQQSKQLQRQFSKDLSGGSMPLPKKPRYPSQPGYQEQILRQKRKQQHKSPQQQRHPQHHLRQGSFNPEMQQKLMSQGPALYNPEDYLSISMARRDMAEKMSKPRCNDSIPDTSSVDRDSMLSQHCLNIISPPDNEQQKCLNDIEQQVLSEVSYPMLLTMTSSDSRSTNIYPRSNNNVRMNYNSDTMNNRMSNTMSYQDIRDSTTTKSSFMDTFQMNNHRFPANQETMIQKRLESGKTHKEIMMMVSRDLQTRGGGGQLTGAAPQQHHQPPPPQLQHQSRLSQEYLPMQQQQILPPQRTSTNARAIVAVEKSIAFSSATIAIKNGVPSITCHDASGIGREGGE